MSDERSHSMPDAPVADESPRRPIRWLAPSEALLGGLGLAGLIGVVIILAFDDAGRPPPAAVAPPAPPAFSIIGGDRGTPGAPGPQGPKGEPGPAGPPGPSGVRVLRVECTGGTCIVQCEDDEMLLSAYCGAARSPATFPGERSASCRTRRPADFVVAACTKTTVR